MKKASKHIIADNVQRLAKKHRHTAMSLGKETETSKTTMLRLMQPSEDSQDPRLKTLEATAEAFKSELWKLFFDGMPLELFEEKELHGIIQMLSQCSRENRLEIYRQIERIAKQDALEKEVQLLKAQQ